MEAITILKINPMTYIELSKQTGLKYQTLYRRINILGWDKEIAISTPLVTPRAYKKILKRKANGNNSR
jgi:hypothetical protein